MTKKPENHRPTTILKITNEEFEKKLKVRIQKGEKFIEDISTSTEKYKLKEEDVHVWDTYNEGAFGKVV